MKNSKKCYFKNTGFHNFGVALDQSKSKKLKRRIKELRKLSKNIFYKNEKEFSQKGRYFRFAPGVKNHNLLLKNELNFDLDFIEKSQNFKKNVTKIMGKNYKVIKKSIIRSVPYAYLPSWVRNKVIDVGRANLNPYIKDEFQDIQHFHTADFHQDMQTGKKFCTFYIYLDTVSRKDSCIKVLEGSHLLGAQPYPHYLRKSNKFKNLWYYNDYKNFIETHETSITGEAGTMFCFHGLALHGTYYNYSKSPRISLRYLIKPDQKNKDTVFMKSFKNIRGKLCIKDMKLARLDKKKDGEFKRTGMLIRN